MNMNRLSASYYTDRPVLPEKMPKKVAMTEWEYQEKHGLDGQRQSVDDISDISDFSFSSDDESRPTSTPKGKNNVSRISTSIDTNKISEALQYDLDFISTSHVRSSQRSISQLEDLEDKISSAKYTYFRDLEAEAQLSPPDDYDTLGSRFSSPYSYKSTQKSQTNRASSIKSSTQSKSSKPKIPVPKEIDDELNTTSLIAPSKKNNSPEKIIIRQSQTAKVAATIENTSFDSTTSSNPPEKSSTLSTTKQKTTKNDTISTFQDISSFHDTLSSDFTMESTNKSSIKPQDKNKLQSPDKKTVTLTQELISTKDPKKTSTIDPLASNITDSTLTTTFDVSLSNMTTTNTLNNTNATNKTNNNNTGITTDNNKNNNTSTYDPLKSSTLTTTFDPLQSTNNATGLSTTSTNKLTVKSRIDASKLKKTDTLKSTGGISTSLFDESKEHKKRTIIEEPGRFKYDPKPIVDATPDLAKRELANIKPKKNVVKEENTLHSYYEPVPDLTPSFLKEDRKKKQKKEEDFTSKPKQKKQLPGIPDEDDLRRQRRLRNMLGTEQMEEIEDNPYPKVKPLRDPKPAKEEKKISEKDRKCFYDPAETKASKLRNQMVRQKIIQQAEADRIKQEEEDERRRRGEAAARRIQPDLLKMKKESEGKKKDIAQRRKEMEQQNKENSEKVRKMLKKVEKKSTLINRATKDINRREAANKIRSMKQKTPDELHWEAVRARREQTYQKLHEMWGSK